MKYILPLTEAETVTLSELMKNHSRARARMRAHVILLSGRELTIKQIMTIYQVDRDTVSRSLTHWETEGLVDLYNNLRSGRPNKLISEEMEALGYLLQEEPRSKSNLQYGWHKPYFIGKVVPYLKRGYSFGTG